MSKRTDKLRRDLDTARSAVETEPLFSLARPRLRAVHTEARARFKESDARDQRVATRSRRAVVAAAKRLGFDWYDVLRAMDADGYVPTLSYTAARTAAERKAMNTVRRAVVASGHSYFDGRREFGPRAEGC